MANEFFAAWNTTLPAFEAMFGETWTFNGTDYPAVAVDVQTSQTQVMKGGTIDMVSCTLYVRSDIYAQSGVSQDHTVTVRGTNLAVLEIHLEGDACVTIICGPAQIDVWGR